MQEAEGHPYPFLQSATEVISEELMAEMFLELMEDSSLQTPPKA